MSIMIDRTRVRQLTARIFEQPVARILMRLKISPIAITLLGLMLAAGATAAPTPTVIHTVIDDLSRGCLIVDSGV